MGSGPLPNPCRGVSLLNMTSESCQGPRFEPGWISWEVWRTYVAWSMDRRRSWCTIVHQCALLGMDYVERLPWITKMDEDANYYGLLWNSFVSLALSWISWHYRGLAGIGMNYYVLPHLWWKVTTAHTKLAWNLANYGISWIALDYDALPWITMDS